MDDVEDPILVKSEKIKQYVAAIFGKLYEHV